ncbi:MAG TPA: hypothetical protein VHT25_12435 [Solirubrobacteraceae bacterium]|nr:hypothetical protein [Solirubrobacteraceae bacterium]
MRCARWLALVLAAIALGGCETTAEKSAQLQRQAKRITLDEKGLSITRASAEVKVVDATVVHDSERAAAVVTLRNGSAHAQHDVPIAIVVKDARGRTLFQNNGAGLEGALVSLPSIGPHATATWVDDQLPATGAPASVSARVGEAPSVASALPQLTIGATQLSEDPASGTVANGSVRNRSAVEQRGLVVFAVGRRAGRVVAAGRAIVPELAAGASAPFQVSLVGEAKGAQLQFAAPPSSVT